MATSLERTALDRARDLLGVPEDTELAEAVKLLMEFRIANHPDKFQDQTAHNLAEERAKEANALIVQLRSLAEQERVQLPARQLIASSQEHEILLLRTTVHDLEEKLRSKESELGYLESQRADLQVQLKKVLRKRNTALERKLVQQSKPSRKSLISLGIIGGLAFGQAALLRLQDFGATIFKYAPISPEAVSALLFAATALVAAWVGLRFSASSFEERRILEIRTTDCAARLIDFAKAGGLLADDMIAERTILAFLQAEVLRVRGLTSFLLRLLRPSLFDAVAVESLKNVMIGGLLEREVLELAHAEELQRTFSVKKKPNFSLFFRSITPEPDESGDEETEDDDAEKAAS